MNLHGAFAELTVTSFLCYRNDSNERFGIAGLHN